jgi:cell division protein FtsI (penicillin-binding protein 3)
MWLRDVDWTENPEGYGASWSQATVEAGETTINAVAIEEGRVPDVRGMGLTDALFLLEKSGLRVTHRGSGRVRTQSLAPGYKIANNTRIELVLER